MKHYIDEIIDIDEDEWKWAVKWKDKIVCITRKQEWAEQIAWALDLAKPFQENNETMP